MPACPHMAHSPKGASPLGKQEHWSPGTDCGFDSSYKRPSRNCAARAGVPPRGQGVGTKVRAVDTLAALPPTGPTRQALAPHPGTGWTARLLLTCQAAVYEVVLLPKPENCLVRGFHGTHGLSGHLLEMVPAFLAPEEGVNVPPDGLQHSLGVAFKTCRGREHRGHRRNELQSCPAVCPRSTGLGPSGAGGADAAREAGMCCKRSHTQEAASAFPTPTAPGAQPPQRMSHD